MTKRAAQAQIMSLYPETAEIKRASILEWMKQIESRRR